MRCIAGLVVVGIVGCSAPPAERAADTATTVATPAPPGSGQPPSAPQPDWRTFQGAGFTLRVPPGTTERSGASHPNDQPGTMLEGPRIGGSVGPSWRLTVATYANVGGTPLTTWVDSVRQASNAASAGDPDSLAWLAPPDTLTIGGGARALRLQPFCGDCEAYELYTAVPGRIVMFGIVYDIGIPGDHEQQRRLYEAILSTFRPEGGQAPRPSA